MAHKALHKPLQFANQMAAVFTERHPKGAQAFGPNVEAFLKPNILFTPFICNDLFLSSFIAPSSQC